MKHLGNAVNAIENLTNEVKDFVVKNDGFINTSNALGNCDQIYGYIIDWDADAVEEQKVVALKVEDDILYIATSPKSIVVIVDSKADFEDDEWYALGTGGDCVLQAQTILSIADSIEQYVAE